MMLHQYGPARIDKGRESPESLEDQQPPPALKVLLLIITVFLGVLISLAYMFEYPEKQRVELVVDTVPESNTVFVMENGTVKNLMVQEQQVVQKGQKLLSWDDEKETLNIVESPISGSVQLLLRLRRGDRIEAGDALMAIIPQSHGLNATGYVQLQTASRLRPGQQVRLFSFDNRQNWRQGRIVSIGPPHVDGRRRVEVEFVHGSEGLIPGQKLYGDVIVGTVRFLPRLFQRIKLRST